MQGNEPGARCSAVRLLCSSRRDHSISDPFLTTSLAVCDNALERDEQSDVVCALGRFRPRLQTRDYRQWRFAQQLLVDFLFFDITASVSIAQINRRMFAMWNVMLMSSKVHYFHIYILQRCDNIILGDWKHFCFKLAPDNLYSPDLNFWICY